MLYYFLGVFRIVENIILNNIFSFKGIFCVECVSMIIILNMFYDKHQVDVCKFSCSIVRDYEELEKPQQGWT